MQCREACGACCIAPSINEAFFGMPLGKPAGTACVHLTASNACALFHDARRPAVCSNFMAEPLVCASDRGQALLNIAALELATAPERPTLRRTD